MSVRSILAFSFAILTSSPAAAWACGGCFSPSSDTNQTVVQNAERVLFAHDPATGKSIVWIEVVYAGSPQQFGWVLPLPKVPKVGVGTRHVFDALDERMAFRVARVQESAENCRDPYAGCEPESGTNASDGAAAKDSSSDTSAGMDAGKPPAPIPGVEVLAQGSAGPYDYAVIKGAEADKLYLWLTTYGYATPEKAKPILQSHADKGDVFLAIKLQNGQGVQSIRPVTLEMVDAEPCVPLRLTSIAAASDMNVTVTVAGTGRAVVKNYLDVMVNPLRLTLLGKGEPATCPPDTPGECVVPSNYAQVLAAAIDEAGGHAFVTEASVPAAALKELSPLAKVDVSSLAAGKTLYDLAMFLATTTLPLDGEVVSTLQTRLGQTGLFMDVSVEEAVAALKACGKYWQKPGAQDACAVGKVTLSKSKVQTVQIDCKGAAEELKAGILDPIVQVGAMLAGSTRATRLVLRISPDEMDRDPVFAFSAMLPEVAPVRSVKYRQVCTDGWNNGPQKTRLTVAGMGSWLLAQTAVVDPQFINAPTALQINVQEEQGAPVPIATVDVAMVDAAILGAKPGKASVPAGLTLKPVQAWTPPPTVAPLTVAGPWHQPSGCKAKPGWQDGKVPPAGDVPVPDALAGEDVAQDSAAAVQDGGTLQDAGGTVKVATPAATKSDAGGCQAGSRPGVVGMWLMLLAIGLVRWRRAAWLVRRG